MRAEAITAIDLKKVWRWILFLMFALLSVSFLAMASHRPSRWQLSLDFTNWRIRQSQQIEFAKGGLEVRSKKTYYFGPITISSEHLWTQEEARPFFGNGMK